MPQASVVVVTVLVALATGAVSMYAPAHWVGRARDDVRGVAWWWSPILALPMASVAASYADNAAELVAFGVMGGLAAILTVVDLAEHRLPNPLVGGLAVDLAVLLTASAVMTGEWADLRRAVLGLLVCGALYLTMGLTAPGSFGAGDVKLGMVLGLFLGWFSLGTVLAGIFAAAVIGGVVALGALALRRASLSTQLPYGQWLLVGALVAPWLAPRLFPAF